MDDPLLLLEGRPVCRLSLSRGRMFSKGTLFLSYLRENGMAVSKVRPNTMQVLVILQHTRRAYVMQASTQVRCAFRSLSTFSSSSGHVVIGTLTGCIIDSTTHYVITGCIVR